MRCPTAHAPRPAAAPAALALLILALLLNGCAITAEPSTADAGSELERLMATDFEFSQTSARLGVVRAFDAYIADDAVLLPQGEPPVQGRAAILEHQRAAGDVRLTWRPVGGGVAGSGDFGYTWGSYQAQVRDEKGQVRVSHGKYTTLWRKDRSGSWKVILDIGNPGPSPTAP